MSDTEGAAAPAPAPAAPAAVASVDADIAAFMASEPAAAAGEDVGALADDAADSPALEQVADDSPDDGPAPAKGPKVDATKLQAAIEAEDLPAFIDAMGPAADTLLTSKAHRALRVAARELTKKQAAATAAEAKAGKLATALADKYADPIAVREAIVKGDSGAVDKFLDYAERTCGAGWNDIMKWVAKGLVGRPDRLSSKTQAAASETTKQEAARAEAMAATQVWVKTEVSKADATLLTDAPEIVDLVIEEIRSGYNRGIVSPAKALPLVLKKLAEQHARLARVVARGKKAKPEAEALPSPAARVGKRADEGKTRPASVDEDIQWIKKEMGLR